ncbi:NAD(P)/FAD-dependent oxidoreductase [Streptomyces purpureus]|uniref:NAD(P)/FAD-dependent oxidoreductase n=1 Tax=Streptomyces purpureus TaxID=1951 RepID=UPI000373ECE2|nr:FAD-dependent oxidoreductase [Streptomyces purpureus]
MNRTVDALVVGAGPAGLAVAARLAALGAGRVEVLEREPEAGGVPRHCHHGGFGGWLPGPVYSRGLTEAAVWCGAVVRTGVSAIGWAGPLTVEVTGPGGLERITARAVVLATGARERPRSARLVPGSRPAGVLTTGELQQAVHLYGQPVGRRAVVVGAEPVAYHAVRTLRRAGARVVALVTEQPRGAWAGTAGRAGGGVLAAPPPVLTGTAVTELLGRGRLSGVRIRHADGRTGVVGCDTVVFTGDWIPDHELARYGGLALDPGTRGPAVDASFRTSEPGVFAVGNVLRGVERAAVAAAEGAAAADQVLAHLSGAPWPVLGPPLVVRAPLVWVSPNRVTGAGAGRMLLRSGAPLVNPVVTVDQDGARLHRARVLGPVSPWRSMRLPLRWTARVGLDGGPVVIGVA